jgi:chitinase
VGWAAEGGVVSITDRPLVEAYWLGYVQSVQNGGQGMDLADAATQTPVDVVKIAFYNLFPSNGLTVCFGMSENHGWGYTQSAIKTLQAAGIKVMVSLIGTPDPLVQWNEIPDPAAFAANVKSLLIDDLGCDGVDLDNEDDATPDQGFVAVVKALRAALGPKGSDKALLTAPTYLPDRDLPYLRQVGDLYDWVSTMAYWDGPSDQWHLWQQYADVLGPSNVLIGVSCCSGMQSTSLATVKSVAQTETQRGLGKTGGMMLWNLSGGKDTTSYYDAIKSNLKIWKPPAPPG